MLRFHLKMDAVTEVFIEEDGAGFLQPKLELELPTNANSGGNGNKCDKPCHLCPEIFTSSFSLNKHIRVAHPDFTEINWVLCTICNVRYPDEKLLKCHKRLNCEKKMFSRHPCQHCKKSFKNANGYFNHMKKYHPNEEPFLVYGCGFCSETFPSLQIQEEHYDQAHPKCSYCPFIPDDGDLTKHYNSSHLDEIKDVWEACSICNFHFPDKDNLLNHTCQPVEAKNQRFVKSLFIKSEPFKEEEEEPLGEDDGLLKCQFCQKVFDGQKGIYYHARKFHPEEVKRDWLQCPNCMKFYPNVKSMMSHHIMSCKRKFKGSESKPVSKNRTCQYCQEKIIGSMIIHVRTDHPDVVLNEWINCDKCGKYFPDKIHKCTKDNLKQLQCLFCPLNFLQIYEMRLHYFSDHPEELKASWLLCDLCQKYFPDGKSLEQHKSNNCDKRVFSVPKRNFVKCNYCDIRFFGKAGIYRHTREEHPEETVENWLKCPHLCGKFYPDKKSLNAHLFSVAPDMVMKFGRHPCPDCDKVFKTKGERYTHVLREHWCPTYDKETKTVEMPMKKPKRLKIRDTEEPPPPPPPLLQSADKIADYEDNLVEIKAEPE